LCCLLGWVPFATPWCVFQLTTEDMKSGQQTR
jgi:hypothetical protein